ncbi:MAG: NeuD/PglB/VioB family sugar acetyltransferase [Flammeovirgaceae bacterium]
MIILGAGGHAKELLGVLAEQPINEDVFFYDDVTTDLPPLLFNKFRILRSQLEVNEVLKKDSRFVIGVGNPVNRYELAKKFVAWGGILTSVVSTSAMIGKFNVKLADGLNIMKNAVITEDVVIGTGSLIHIQSCVHHDCRIGQYCEILPGSRLLGGVRIGDYTSIGSGAIVLPKVKIGTRVKVGAGAVVTKDVSDDMTVKGVPAK